MKETFKIFCQSNGIKPSYIVSGNPLTWCDFAPDYKTAWLKLVVGSLLKKTRKEFGFTQTEIANRIHSTQTKISLIESGDWDSFSLVMDYVIAVGLELE